MPDLHVDTGSARLATTDSGVATGASAGTVVALHAGVADRRSWSACTPAWTEAGWRVVAYDRRGFGDSAWTAVEHSPLDDLVAVMDDRGIDRAVLIGNSMGGGLAIDAALARPDRVRALVLVGSALSGQTELLAEMTESELEIGEAIGAAEEVGDLDEVNRLECQYWLDGPGAVEGRVAGPARQLFLDMNGIALRADDVGDQRPAPAAWDRLDDIDVPVSVIVGDLDERDVVAIGHKLATEIAGARLTRLPHSAHLPMLDDAARFAEETSAFLATVR